MSEIVLQVSEPDAVELEYVEAKIKPEVTGHATPTYEQQTVNPVDGTTFGSFVVEPIPDPTAIKEISTNGDHDVARYGTARVDVQPALQQKTVTPTEQQQTVEADSGFDALSRVTVNRIPPQYIVPSGSLPIGQDGTYNVSQYAEAVVSTSSEPTKGVVPSDFDSDGYPQKLKFVGSWSEIPQNLIKTDRLNYFKNVTDIELPDGVSILRNYCLSYMKKWKTAFIPDSVTMAYDYCIFAEYGEMETVSLGGNISFWGKSPFANGVKNIIFRNHTAAMLYSPYYGFGTNSVMLIDLSHNTSVATLAGSAQFRHATNCVIRVPQSLLAEWQTATNWCDLTNVVWEGV